MAPDNRLNEEVLKQNPLVLFMLLLVFALIVLGLLGSLTSWMIVLARKNRGLGILPLKQPWQPRKWALIEVLGIVIGALFLNSILAFTVARALGIQRGGEIPIELAAAGAVGSLLAVVAGTFWVCVRYGVNMAHVGFDKLSFRSLATGIMAALISLPGMYLLMVLASSLSQIKYEHPLIDSAIEDASLLTYVLAAFSAGLAAPIAEEFFFRVILQGWMQSIPFKNAVDNIIGDLTFGGEISDDQALNQHPQPTVIDQTTGQIDYSATSSGSGWNETSSNLAPAAYSENRNVVGSPASKEIPTVASIYEPIAVDNNIEPMPTSAQSQTVPPMWPSVVTGLLFGFAHFDYGMSFIPLSFLGIFLGWLYRQTHSIWPCIVVHMMLNCTSMLMLGLAIVMKVAGIEIGK